MSRSTSSERRGLIALLAIIAVIIVAMVLYSGFGRSSYRDPLPPAAQLSDTAATDTSETVVNEKKRKTGRRHAKADTSSRRKKSYSRRKQSSSGHQRDYLDEPVESSHS